jgi:hypothetical protein
MVPKSYGVLSEFIVHFDRKVSTLAAEGFHCERQLQPNPHCSSRGDLMLALQSAECLEPISILVSTVQISFISHCAVLMI